MSKYTCPTCQKDYTAEQAKASNYRCPEDRTYLVARVGSAVRPATVILDSTQVAAMQQEGVALAAPIAQAAAPATTSDRLRNALQRHRPGTPGSVAQVVESAGTRPDEPSHPVVEQITAVILEPPTTAPEATPEPVTAPSDASALLGMGPINTINNAPHSGADPVVTTPLASASPPAVNANPANNTPPPDAPPPPALSSDPQLSTVRAYVVLPPPTNLKDAAAMEQLAGTLAHIPAPVALEIVGTPHGRQLVIRGRPEAVEYVSSQLYAVYNQLELQPLISGSDDPDTSDYAADFETGAVAACRLVPAEPHFLPIKTWREFENSDPLVAILGAFNGLRADERALSQVTIRGAAPQGWADEHLQNLMRLKRRGYGGDAPAATGAILRGVVSMVCWLFMLGLGLWAWPDWPRWFIAVPIGVVLLALGVVTMPGRNHWAGAMEDDAAMKLKDQALVVEVRLFAKAATPERAAALLARLTSAYRMFDTTSANKFTVEPLEALRPNDFETLHDQRDFLQRLIAWGDAPSGPIGAALLNVSELAGMWHMPVAEALELVKRQTWERILPLPSVLAGQKGAYVGISWKGLHAVKVCLPLEAMNRNIFILGKTQHGKTTLMEHIAAWWMSDPNRTVVIVDPHGDLARRAIGLVPPERLDDVIYIDCSDETRVVAFNMIDAYAGSGPDKVAETFISVGKALWKNFWGPRMVIPLSFALRTLAAVNRRHAPDDQYTLLTIPDLLNAENNVRSSFLSFELQPADQYPDILRYFRHEYEGNSASHREQVIAPVLSKIHAFERSGVVRNMVGQPQSSVNFREALRGHKIIIVNTSIGAIGDDMAGFIGSLLLNIIRQIITGQADLPREQRTHISVVADEFQVMGGVDFGGLLGELQKYGGNFVFGTQSLDNLRSLEEGGTLPGKIFAGVTTTIALQSNGADADYLVKTELDFKRLQPESLINISRHHAYMKTGDARERIPVFSFKIADPLRTDPQVARQVLGLQQRYTIPAEVADAQARAAIGRFGKEFSAGPSPAYEGENDSRGSAVTTNVTHSPTSTPVPTSAVPGTSSRQRHQQATEAATVVESRNTAPATPATAEPSADTDRPVAKLPSFATPSTVSPVEALADDIDSLMNDTGA